MSSSTVGQLLHQAGYSLQGNVKVREGSAHQDRDAQFGYLNGQVADHQQGDAPVVSVDTKKKELVGDYKNNGQQWLPQGKPERVQVHDFPDPKVGKAIPYGVYDLAANTGWVSVGQDHDTSAFAVATLRRWWFSVGQIAYPLTDRLLICADAGGSNGYRVRLWQVELARLATEIGRLITVCHLPPGTSKWNKLAWSLETARVASNACGGLPGAVTVSILECSRTRNNFGAGPREPGLSLRARTPDSVLTRSLLGGSFIPDSGGGVSGAVT